MSQKKHHPIWETVDKLVIFGGVTLVLLVNASSFDSTELMSIVEIGVLAWGRDEYRKRKQRRESSEEGAAV